MPLIPGARQAEAQPVVPEDHPVVTELAKVLQKVAGKSVVIAPILINGSNFGEGDNFSNRNGGGAAGGGEAVATAPGEAPPAPVDLDAERERIRQEERQRAAEEAEQRLQEILAQQPTAQEILNRINEAVTQATEPLTQRIGVLETELTQERERHQQELADRDAEIERLNQRIAQLEGQGNGDALPSLEEFIQARMDLVDITIRRKSRTWFDRFVPWRRGERREYEQRLEAYSSMVERLQAAETARRVHRGEDLAIVLNDHEDNQRQLLSDLAEEVYVTNRDRVRDVIDNGGFMRRNWAKATWFWGNRPWWQKGLSIAVVGGSVALVSATAGLGLAFMGAGAAAKFSVSYFNNRSGVRNLAKHNLTREQARIQESYDELAANRHLLTLNERRDQLGELMPQVHERNVKRDRVWNTIGKTALVGGGVVTLLSIIDVPVNALHINWGALRGHQPWDGNNGGSAQPNGPGTTVKPGAIPGFEAPSGIPAHTHIEALPDGHGGIEPRVLVRLPDGDHLFNQAGHIGIAGKQGEILGQVPSGTSAFTGPGSVSENLIRLTNLHHAPNEYFSFKDQYGHVVRHTITALTDNELPEAA